MIIAIVATDNNYGIAKNGKIPWRSKEDFAFFKSITTGNGNNAIIMGRRTKESLPNFPLPGRKNIVLTSSPSGENDISSWDEIIEMKHKYDDLFIIGGGEIYKQAFEQSIPDKILISRIPGNFGCDKFINIDDIKKNYITDKYQLFSEFCLETLIRL